MFIQIRTGISVSLDHIVSIQDSADMKTLVTTVNDTFESHIPYNEFFKLITEHENKKIVDSIQPKTNEDFATHFQG